MTDHGPLAGGDDAPAGPAGSQARGAGRKAGGASGAATGTVRVITGFHQDEEGDWVAELSCLHTRHMRHEPPFQSRPWVIEAAGRQARTGMKIGCAPCDRAEMPGGLVLIGAVGPFSEETLPAGLRRSHRTAAAVWGLLRVTSGAAGFRLEVRPPLEVLLTAGSSQPIPPEIRHDLTVTGPVQLIIEFWGAAS